MRYQQLLKILVVCLLAGQTVALAQVTTGTILGTVADPTGAVIPGSTITIRNVETGITRTVATDAGGRYRVQQLGLGDYEVTAESAGFQTVVRSGITLTVGREAVVDFSLQVGAVTERITVTGEAPLIETTNATVAGLISEQSMRSLPLNGRSFGDLASLSPGVIANLPVGNTNGQGSVYSGGGGAARRVISGAKPQQATWLLDGIELTTPSRGMPVDSVVGSQLGTDSVREFSVIQSVAGAQFGRAAGGVVNAVTQSGTNIFRGGVFESLRNNALDARDYFVPSFFNETPYKRNQFGGFVGGPIKKDHTFFFANYEGMRIAAATSNLGTTLTPETRQGRITNAQGQVTQTIANWDKNLVVIMDLLPLPTVLANGSYGYRSGGVADYYSQLPYNVDENYGILRVDQQFSEKDSFFGRGTYDRSNSAHRLALLTPVPDISFQKGAYFVGALSWTRVISPTLLNTARIGFTRRNDAMWQTYTRLGTEFKEGRGLDPRLEASKGVHLGSYSIAGVSIPGGVGPGTSPGATFTDNTFDYGDSLIITRGSHSITVGANLKRYQMNFSNDTWAHGSGIQWATIQEFLRNDPRNTTQELGFVNPDSYAPDSIRGWRQTYGALFVQDDFQLRSNLAVNLGVRWEQVSSPREVNGKLAALVNFYSDAGLTALNDSSAPYFAIRAPLKGLSPRVGLAWSLGKTVVRSGFGTYMEMPLGFVWASAFDVPPYAVRYTVNRPNLKWPYPFADPFSIPNSQEPLVLPHSMKEPNMIQWNLSIERQLAEQWVVRAQYLGLRGTNQFGPSNPNQQFITYVNGRPYTPADSPFPNPNFTGMRFFSAWGDQYYHAGQLVVEKRYSGGLLLNSSYTWSRNIDDVPSATRCADTLSGAGALSPYNNYDLKQDKSLSPYHVAHNWISTVRYELPFGSGQRWGSGWTGVTNKLLGGWALSANQTARTGLPINLTMTPRQ
ncbi:MAG: TonB-dependent receptor, partial [Acidobacteria bacterium]|nr:TonB-dependent receptor [Acidobacteriota bacterium]